MDDTQNDQIQRWMPPKTTVAEPNEPCITFSGRPESIITETEILASHSKYFNRLLEDKGKTLRLDHRIIQHDLLTMTMEFVYTRTLPLQEQTLQKLFEFSITIEMEDLRMECELQLISLLNLANLFDFLQLSHKHAATLLNNSCMEYIQSNADTVLSSSLINIVDNLKSIPIEFLTSLLKSDFIVKEEKVMHLVLNWGRLHSEHRWKEELLPLVRLVCLSRESLQDLYRRQVLPRNILIEVLFAKLNYRYSLTSTTELYLRPRAGIYLKLSDFEHEGQYAEYLKGVLVPGVLCRATETYENIRKGDVGEFVEHNMGYPPCQISWHGFGSPYWVYWRHVEVVIV